MFQPMSQDNFNGLTVWNFLPTVQQKESRCPGPKSASAKEVYKARLLHLLLLLTSRMSVCCRVRRNWEAQRALRLTKIEQPIVGLLRWICLLNYFKERKALDIPIKNESWYKSEGRKYKVQGSLLSLKLYKTGKFHNILMNWARY